MQWKLIFLVVVPVPAKEVAAFEMAHLQCAMKQISMSRPSSVERTKKFNVIKKAGAEHRSRREALLAGMIAPGEAFTCATEMTMVFFCYMITVLLKCRLYLWCGGPVRRVIGGEHTLGVYM